jgi:tRNA modification GTPase
MDTIAAISTAFGEAAIALIRLSGPRSVEIADSAFRSAKRAAELPARFAQFGCIFDGGRKLDDVLLTVFRAPASYTGEDVVEISCHGGVLVSRRILETFLRAGARSAEPGEFTQRAFLNHKLDLTQAEAVMDVISAETDLALRSATEQLEGRLGDRIRGLKQRVLEILAHIEAFIDFPDEDIDPDTGTLLRARIDAADADVEALLATARQGRVLREGVRTVICGAPNAGKSSLLNLLLGYERAIVSTRPGTTRDVLEEAINLGGIPVRLMDTAGLRDTDDELELAGMERTRRALSQAELVLHVVDASVEKPRGGGLPGPVEGGVTNATDAAARALRVEILVLNKSDLGVHASWGGGGGVALSSLTGEGVDALIEAITRAVTGGAAHANWSVAINARHKTRLEAAREYLRAARRTLDDGLSPEFTAEELRAAMDAIGDIVGRADSEELLGVIFGCFCIGK